MHFIKIVVLGASGVGKTAIVQQFTMNEFSDKLPTTHHPATHTQTVMLENRVYQLKIIDLPPIMTFPPNSMEEWTRGLFGVRTASAYLLVYDASNLETFMTVKMLKEQMFDSRDMHNVPVLVVANKYDLTSLPTNSVGGGVGGGFGLHLYHSSSSSSHHHHLQHLHHHYHHHNHFHQQHNNYESRERREICSMVRKQWKLSHVECSAKYNWRVVGLFKELTRMTSNVIDLGQGHNSNPLSNNLNNQYQFHNQHNNNILLPSGSFPPSSGVRGRGGGWSGGNLDRPNCILS